MDLTLILSQLLNGVQYGVLLFLLAAGLTLVFGIMSFVNLAHGSLYMLGAYFGATAYNHTDSFVLAIIAAVGGCILVGIILERTAISRLYMRDHLDHVLVTFGLVLFFNEMAQIIWGTQPYFLPVPSWLDSTVEIFGMTYPSYRFAIIVAGLLAAIGSHLLIHTTRLGPLIPAGPDHPHPARAPGVNITLLTAF